VLCERHSDREPARADAKTATELLVDEPEDGAVRGMQREAGETPARPARDRLAEERDVGVVAAQQPLVERLREPPDGRRRGAGRRGS